MSPKILNGVSVHQSRFEGCEHTLSILKSPLDDRIIDVREDFQPLEICPHAAEPVVLELRLMRRYILGLEFGYARPLLFYQPKLILTIGLQDLASLLETLVG